MRGADSIERFLDAWFGLSHPNAAREIERAGFEAEAFDSYCPRCGLSVGEGEVARDGRCGGCRSEVIHFDRCVRLASYEPDGPAREWIHQLKFERWSDMGRRLGAILAERILARETIDRGRSIVVPAPMPWQRRIYRGVDHARIIAAACARSLDVPLCSVLSKRNGPTQMSLTATQRRANLRGRIAVTRRAGGWPLAGVTVILVDDVRTTGTTLNTSARLLKTACSAERVIAAVVAVADAPGRRRAKSASDRADETRGSNPLSAGSANDGDDE